MERLRTFLADLSRLFAQLSRRERLLVGLAALSVVVFAASIALSSVRSGIDRRELSIEEKQLQLQQVGIFAQSFTQNERARKDLEARLAGPPVSLLSHMQQLADKNGLVISSMNDRGETTTDGVKESLVELQIASTPVDKLTALLNELERGPRILKVRKLRMRKGTDDKALNVTLTVGAYGLAQGK